MVIIGDGIERVGGGGGGDAGWLAKNEWKIPS